MGNSNTTNGKGDKPRPIKDIKKYNDNYDLIFKTKNPEDEKSLEKKEEVCDNN
jgi:hypothetical protein